MNKNATIFKKLSTHEEVMARARSNIDTSYICQVTDIAHNTFSNLDEQKSQCILKSCHAWRMYGPDKVYHQIYLPLTSECDLYLSVMNLGLTRDTPFHQGGQTCQDNYLKILTWTEMLWSGQGLSSTLTCHCDLDL